MKKLKSRKGTTLAEMLVALILLSLLTAGGAAATSAVMTDYNKMSEAARAELLASTVIEAINDQVRLGNDLTIEGDALRLDSAFFGEDSLIRLEGDRLVAEVKASSGTGTETKNILSEKTYGGLKLDELTFQEVLKDGVVPDLVSKAGKSVFIVSFQVKSAYGDAASAPLWSGSVAVAPLRR